MDTELMRIGISLPDSLLSKFDEIIGKRDYSNRSEGIRDAIRSYISNQEWMDAINGHHVGTIAVMYNHTKRGISNALADIQHQYAYLIKSSLHIDLNHDDSLDVVVVEGEGKEITKLTESMMALKGVKLSKLTTLSSNEGI